MCPEIARLDMSATRMCGDYDDGRWKGGRRRTADEGFRPRGLTHDRRAVSGWAGPLAEREKKASRTLRRGAWDDGPLCCPGAVSTAAETDFEEAGPDGGSVWWCGWLRVGRRRRRGRELAMERERARCALVVLCFFNHGVQRRGKVSLPPAEAI